MQVRRLVIIGAGGLGIEALWVARRIAAVSPERAFEVIGFADDASDLQGTLVDGLPVLGGVELLAAEYAGRGVFFHSAIGDNRIRQRVAARLEAAGLVPAALVDPSSVVAETAEIGAGSYVGPQVNVSPHARVGRHVIINTQVSVGHHSNIGDFAQLCPGVRVSGRGVAAEGAFVGSNAVIAPAVRIEPWSTLGACSFALRNVPEGVTALGNPARVMLR